MRILILFLILGFLGPAAEAAPRPVGISHMIELTLVAKAQGFSNPLLPGSVSCRSTRAIRIDSSRKIEYRNVWYHLDIQMEYAGKLFVSLDTKCVRGFPSGWDNPFQWRFVAYWNDFPHLMSAGAYLSHRHDIAKPWCRVSRLGVSFDFKGTLPNQTKYTRTYNHVVIYLPNDWNEFDEPFSPAAHFVYFSKDIKCFAEKNEAVKGPYKEIVW